MDAFIYTRWSSLEQTNTTSAERQAAAIERFVEGRGWNVAERLSDEGKSAWTGDNLVSGSLGRFLQRVEREGGSGKVLVVEKLDRLSRQAPLAVMGWLQRACATGLTIASADGAHYIDAARLQRDQMTVVGAIFFAFRGFEESQAKSERVGAAWALKRQRGAAMTRQCPPWLTIEPGHTSYRSEHNATAGYRLVPDRAALVRRIFDMADSGLGQATIARTLNREGVSTWCGGVCWHASYIKKMLANPAVIGEFQPHTKPKGGERKPQGPVLSGYFPAAISLEQFYRVNDARRRRVVAQQSPQRLVNLLAGLARCSSCGSTMTLTNKGNETLASGRVVPRRYFRCTSAHRGTGCGARRTFEHSLIETTILDKMLHLAMDDQHFANKNAAADLEGRLAHAQREQVRIQRLQAVAFDAMEEDPEDELARARYAQRRDEAKALAAEIRGLEKEVAAMAGRVSPAEHVARVAEVRAMMDAEDEQVRYEARSRVKLALNDLVEVVEFSSPKNRFSVALKDGVRAMAWDGVGREGMDVDWIALRPNVPAPADPVLRSYARRRAASASA